LRKAAWTDHSEEGRVQKFVNLIDLLEETALRWPARFDEYYLQENGGVNTKITTIATKERKPSKSCKIRVYGDAWLRQER
jgi:hypothetical protein